MSGFFGVLGGALAGRGAREHVLLRDLVRADQLVFDGFDSCDEGWCFT